MHHVVLERWSRGNTFLHRRDARAKILAALILLIAIATARPPLGRFAMPCFFLLLVAAAAGRLPVPGALWRAALVLPFTVVFALIAWAGGDPARAQTLLVKSYLSAMAVLILAGVSPLPALLNGIEKLGAPRFLLLVTHFVYRYLFVLSEEAQHMRIAAVSRGARNVSAARRAAAGAVAVLFARSYERAEAVHHAMLARGFRGRLRTLNRERFGLNDAAFLAIFAAAVLLLWAKTGA
jgi:cobalt/nickel transport system permease protein